ncbi:MAG: futalosine hydrolase [Bacteroidales bacterium]
MKVLLVSATSFEIEPLFSGMRLVKKHEGHITSYAAKNLELDVLLTGVGMVATAYWLGRTLSAKSYDVAINAGICGSFDRRIAIGEVVDVAQDSFPEMGAEDGEYFLSLIDLDLLGRDEFPFTNGILENKGVFDHPALGTLRKVKGVTVNKVHGHAESIMKFLKDSRPDIETMEGAAFLYACQSIGLKCLQLRSVSNYIETRDRTAWNIPLAIRNLNLTLSELLSG